MQGVVSGVYPYDSEQDKATTIGQPMPHVEVKIAYVTSGTVLELGAEGEICIRGYQTMLSYFNMPAETAETITPDGWLRSGDLGTLDRRGFLIFTGRIKDIIVRGGENIYPREIEAMLLEHPAVADVEVVGVPAKIWGVQVGAVVIPASGTTFDAAALYAYCRERLAAYKAPRL